MFAAGLLLGTAGMMKQTAAFTAVALFAAIFWRARGHRLPAAAAFGIGWVCVPFGFALVYWIDGHLPALLAGAVFGAAGRLGGDNISFLDGLLRFFPTMKPLIVLLAATAFLATRGWRLRGRALAVKALPRG